MQANLSITKRQHSERFVWIQKSRKKKHYGLLGRHCPKAATACLSFDDITSVSWPFVQGKVRMARCLSHTCKTQMANWGSLWENMLPTYGWEYGFTGCHDKTNGSACKKLCKFAGIHWMKPHGFLKNLWLHPPPPPPPPALSLLFLLSISPAQFSILLSPSDQNFYFLVKKCIQKKSSLMKGLNPWFLRDSWRSNPLSHGGLLKLSSLSKANLKQDELGIIMIVMTSVCTCPDFLYEPGDTWIFWLLNRT